MNHKLAYMAWVGETSRPNEALTKDECIKNDPWDLVMKRNPKILGGGL